jgi:hypothetical protein
MDPLNVGSKLDPQRLDLAENLSMKNNLAYFARPNFIGFDTVGK